MPPRVLTVSGSLQAISANRAALDVARDVLGSLGVEVDDYEGVGLIPPFNPDSDPNAVVIDWRHRIALSDAVLIAAPEYAGALAGSIKNALDWIVGSGELYGKPVGVISAGTGGGMHARRMLIHTLTWQGAHVVAQLGVAAPRTKSDPTGRFTDQATLAEIERVASMVASSPALTSEDLLYIVRGIVIDAGIDPVHIAPGIDRESPSVN